MKAGDDRAAAIARVALASVKALAADYHELAAGVRCMAESDDVDDQVSLEALNALAYDEVVDAFRLQRFAVLMIAGMPKVREIAESVFGDDLPALARVDGLAADIRGRVDDSSVSESDKGVAREVLGDLLDDIDALSEEG